MMNDFIVKAVECFPGELDSNPASGTTLLHDASSVSQTISSQNSHQSDPNFLGIQWKPRSPLCENAKHSQLQQNKGPATECT